jgi:DNA uptake protein ComE-like DNA-binding protein
MGDFVDLNKASKEEIDAVPPLRGHGPEIVRVREERGRFTKLRELEEVPGLAGKIDQEELAALGVGVG